MFNGEIDVNELQHGQRAIIVRNENLHEKVNSKINANAIRAEMYQHTQNERSPEENEKRYTKYRSNEDIQLLNQNNTKLNNN